MTAPIIETNHTQLEALIKRWEARWRTRRLILWLPRVLLVALFLSALIALIVRTTGMLNRDGIALIVGIVLGAIIIGAGSYLRLFGRQGMNAAREFDRLFSLQDRMTTALELMQGRIKTVPEIAQRQLDDTLEHARDIDPKQGIPLEIRPFEYLMVVVFALLLVIVLAIPDGVGNSHLSPATQLAISDAVEDVRDITEDIATDSALTAEERSTLLESLEASLNDLQNPETTAEDSFVTMNDLQAELQSQADRIRDQLAAQAEALEFAADALSNPSQTDLSEQSSGTESLAQMIEDLQEALQTLSPEEQAQLAESLQRAAEAAQEQASSASEQMQDAANALNENDLAGAQEALQSLSEELGNLSQQAGQRASAAENLENMSQQAQQSAQDIAQSEQEENQASVQPEDSQSQSEGQSAQAEQSGGQQPQEGSQQGQEGQDGQQGQGQQEGGSPVQSNSEQAQQSASSEQQASGQSSEQQASNSDSGEGTGGSGTGETQSRQEDVGSAQGDNQVQSNNAEGEGETTYQALYAPNALNADGTSNIILQADGGDAPVREGNFQENPDGTVGIPYNQVFQSYASEANRAVESDYIPLGLRDVVRDYFTSLAPSSSGE